MAGSRVEGVEGVDTASSGSRGRGRGREAEDDQEVTTVDPESKRHETSEWSPNAPQELSNRLFLDLDQGYLIAPENASVSDSSGADKSVVVCGWASPNDVAKLCGVHMEQEPKMTVDFKSSVEFKPAVEFKPTMEFKSVAQEFNFEEYVRYSPYRCSPVDMPPLGQLQALPPVQVSQKRPAEEPLEFEIPNFNSQDGFREDSLASLEDAKPARSSTENTSGEEIDLFDFRAEGKCHMRGLDCHSEEKRRMNFQALPNFV